MTPEELELARSLLATVQNTTVQGWDILLNGTVMESILDLIGVVLFSLFGWVGFNRILEIIPTDFDDDMGRFWQGAAGVVFLLLLAVAINVVLSSTLGIFAPQYTILDRILGGFQ